MPIFQNDTGTVIEITIWDIVDDDKVILPIGAATKKDIILKKPDGTMLTKAASFTTDGSDGMIEFTSLATDFDKPGDYRLQAYIEMPSGSWHSTRNSFIVEFNL